MENERHEIECGQSDNGRMLDEAYRASLVAIRKSLDEFERGEAISMEQAFAGLRRELKLECGGSK